MNAFFKTILRTIVAFLASPVKRRLLFIGVLGLVALIDFFVLGVARRTFVFYTIDCGSIVVEDRMLKHSKSRENDIIRYIEEALLGPVSPDLLPLFPRDTKLKSLMYRNRVVFADFSESAALPPLEIGIEGGKTIDNFRTLYEGILRNFSYVKDIRFFIEGNSVFLGTLETPDFYPAETD
jgi:hypothetical protein